MYLHHLLVQKREIKSKLKYIHDLLHKPTLDLDISTLFAIKDELEELKSKYKSISKQSNFLLN